VAATRLTGILLVGGASRRFGAPKALATFHGETLVERAWHTLGELTSDRIAVGKSGELDLPFDVLDDGSEIRAALAGIIAGLRVARSELVVVLPVDSPLVRAVDLLALAYACADCAHPQTGPLPCALRRRTLPTLERHFADHEFALRDAFAELDTRIVHLDARRLANVNAPSDLVALPR
jgi:molybdopterin-guanine dinucleotide biosynthesis protein A